MKRRHAWLGGLLLGWAAGSHAEMRLLATATTDSYRSLTYGVSAFCQAAGFPLALADINAQAAETLRVPGLSGVDVQNHMWLLWLMSDRTNNQERSLATVAVLPTVDQAVVALQALRAVYGSHVWDDEQRLWRFSRPPTNTATLRSAAIAPVVYAANQEDYLFVSTSPDGVTWAAKHPIAHPPAAAIAIAGQIRVEIQPVTLAALLKASREQRAHGQNDDVSDAFERLLAEVRTLSLVVEASTEGVNASLSINAGPDTPLFARLHDMHAPAPFIWRLAPEQAPFAMASGGLNLWDLLSAYTPTNHPVAAQTSVRALANNGLNGDASAFVGRTSPTGTIYYASLLGTTNSAVAWQYAIADPQTLIPFMPSFNLATNGTRTVAGCHVLDLVFTEGRANNGTTNNPADMAAFMLRDGGMSLAATTNLLIVAFGPSNAINHILERVNRPADTGTSLPARCRKLLPNMPDAVCMALLLQPVALVRQIAESLPGMNPERIASLPEPGDGIVATALRGADGTLSITLRVSANEVARGQQAMREGQAALQEMFMQMAVQQLLQQRIGPSAPRRQHPDAKP